MSLKNCFLLFLLCFCFSLLSGTGVAGVQMPSFSLPQASDGKIVESSTYQGQAMLITFFATWCPPCIKEIDALKALQKKYGEQNFTVLGLSVDEKGPSVVNKLIKKENINYPVLMADRLTARKFGGIVGIPTTFLINKKGQVVKKYPGYIPRSSLEKDIKSVL